jgi:hypothetical protein
VSGQPQRLAVTATIEPPAYTGRSATRVENPERIDALAGSRLVLSLAGGTTRWRVRFGADVIQPSTDGPAGSISLVLRQSGYLAIEPTDGAVNAQGGSCRYRCSWTAHPRSR